jgi:hypothetical protein
MLQERIWMEVYYFVEGFVQEKAIHRRGIHYKKIYS